MVSTIHTSIVHQMIGDGVISYNSIKEDMDLKKVENPLLSGVLKPPYLFL